MIYVINVEGFYFKVSGEVDQTKFTNCRIFNDEAAMYQAVVELTGLELDEVESNEISFLYRESSSKWQECDTSGCCMDIEEVLDGMPIEQYISNWVC